MWVTLLKGAQIGLHGLSRAGACARARRGGGGAFRDGRFARGGGVVERMFDDVGHAN
uniref:Uncharacterized protein n=1 Tax=Siphoviridae sp. ctUWs1 TaxID=2826352 RepID=A0A8S5QV49_9CAUD|nr:MAG TPA: hypothetical protein [Siphoviridae sp. ctUWs1]